MFPFRKNILGMVCWGRPIMDMLMTAKARDGIEGYNTLDHREYERILGMQPKRRSELENNLIETVASGKCDVTISGWNYLYRLEDALSRLEAHFVAKDIR